MKKIILLIVVLFITYKCTAKTSVFYASSAGHIKINSYCGEPLNENINMFGVSHNNYYFASFNNSFSQQTYIVAKKSSYKFGKFDVSVMTGIMHGYSLQYILSCDGNREADFLPLIAPSVGYSFGPFKINLMLMTVAYTIVAEYDL